MDEKNISINYRQGVIYKLTTIDDISLVRNTAYDSVYREKGLLLPAGKSVHEIRYILFRLLLNPDNELCELINKYTHSFSSSYIIGLQLRVGGKMRNRVDHVFKDTQSVKHIVDSLKELIDREKSRQNVTVFISTDSDTRLEYIKNYLAPTPVVYVKEYMIGHSASRHALQNYTEWIASTKRAIVDMMILKDCDYLITSWASSFGETVRDLQQSYGLDVNVDYFLRQRGLSCSVFHRAKPLGEYTVM